MYVQVHSCHIEHIAVQRLVLPHAGNTTGFWTQIKMHSRHTDWMLALVRRQECWNRELDKWCTTDLFMTQVQARLCRLGHAA